VSLCVFIAPLQNTNKSYAKWPQVKFINSYTSGPGCYAQGPWNWTSIELAGHRRFRQGTNCKVCFKSPTPSVNHRSNRCQLFRDNNTRMHLDVSTSIWIRSRQAAPDAATHWTRQISNLQQVHGQNKVAGFRWRYKNLEGAWKATMRSV
jgi:hypothetical protein